MNDLSGEIYLKLDRRNRSYVEGSLKMPAPGTERQLVEGDHDAGCWIRVASEAAPGAKGTVKMSDEDLEKLKSLGYMN